MMFEHSDGDVMLTVSKDGGETFAAPRRVLQISVAEGGVGRRTTGRVQPDARLYVYGRADRPCRRCGTLIQFAKQGRDARSTYWCPRCQPDRATGHP